MKTITYKKKSQIAVEFMLYSGLAIILVTALIVMMGSYQSQKKAEIGHYEATNLGRNIQKELIVTSEVKKGIHRTIKIPYTILGNPFIINTYESQIEINYKGSSQYFNTPLLSGTLNHGENNITTNETTILIN